MNFNKKKLLLILVPLIIVATITYLALYTPYLKIFNKENRYTNEKYRFSIKLNSDEKTLVCNEATSEMGSSITLAVIEADSEQTTCDENMMQFISAIETKIDLKKNVKDSITSIGGTHQESSVSGINGDRYTRTNENETVDFTVLKNDKSDNYYIITSDYYNRDFKTLGN